MRPGTNALLAFLLLVSLMPLGAQTTLHSFAPGGPVSRAGDVDGDGSEDLVVGSRVYSSQSGQLLAQLPPLRAFGLGDVDGDGHGDLLRWSPGAWSIDAWSPTTGAVLWSQTLGLTSFSFDDAVIEIDDLDADGIRDLLCCEFGAAVARRGADGTPLWSLATNGSQGPVFADLRLLDDIDGDGVRDFVLSSGAVGVYSGANASLLIAGYTGLWPLGDVNGDGFGDVARMTGAMDEYSRHVYLGPNLSLGGLVLEAEYLNRSAGIGDWNGDGADEVCFFTDRAKNPGGHDGRITEDGDIVLATGTTLDELNGMNTTARGWPGLGGSFASLGDLDGDGRTDFALGLHPWSPNSSPARIYRSQLRVASQTQLPGGCTATPAILSVHPGPWLGSELRVRSSSFDSAYLFAVIPPSNPTGCGQQLQGTLAVLIAPFQVQHSLNLPADPQLSGVPVTLQAFYPAPGNPGAHLSAPLGLVLDGWF